MTTSASSRARRALSVKSSGSPGPAPTSATRPDVRGAFERWSCRAALTGHASHLFLPPDQKLRAPRSGRSRDQKLRVWARQRAAPRRLAEGLADPRKRPSRAGSRASRSALIIRASTGAAPSVPMATVTGSRSTMAGVMNWLPPDCRPNSPAPRQHAQARPRGRLRHRHHWQHKKAWHRVHRPAQAPRRCNRS